MLTYLPVARAWPGYLFFVCPSPQRAQDMCNKHIHLSETAQKLQQPHKRDLWPILKHLQQRELERV